MAVKIKDHIPKSTTNNRRPALHMDATTITIHNTGNPSSTARNERAWLTNPSNSRQASYHLVVDEHDIIECLPLNENAWHAGDGNGSKSGNRTSIGIEICESGNYVKALDNAVEVVATLLNQRGWSTDRLRRHYDWSGKICPRLMYDKGTWAGWNKFKTMVAAKMQPKEEAKSSMTKEDANKLIEFLKASYGIVVDAGSRKEVNRLANELRSASGQPTQ